jgi:hypothetical protein
MISLRGQSVRTLPPDCPDGHPISIGVSGVRIVRTEGAKTPTRRWSPEHLRLACVAVQVRAELRRIAATLPPAERAALGRLAALLTSGLKARAKRAA